MIKDFNINITKLLKIFFNDFTEILLYFIEFYFILNYDSIQNIIANRNLIIIKNIPNIAKNINDIENIPSIVNDYIFYCKKNINIFKINDISNNTNISNADISKIKDICNTNNIPIILYSINDINILKFNLENGFDSNIYLKKYNKIFTALQCALCMKSYECVTLLLKYFDYTKIYENKLLERLFCFSKTKFIINISQEEEILIFLNMIFDTDININYILFKSILKFKSNNFKIILSVTLIIKNKISFQKLENDIEMIHLLNDIYSKYSILMKIKILNTTNFKKTLNQNYYDNIINKILFENIPYNKIFV